ncbi:HNH endonuclease signature motif containing protein [Alkalihalobacillus sp. LMS39]|uniref:HNH endonuclease n=1 Tax=Alkalihalobacillus sp. LMS39 TaxID=2924032 RepID=UPI001FB35DD0|nr:HNH endonuclease signature motif containing protein [Alkalihalobacillus sp. LMS39]UOE96065.1 HNH endonuclease [Alkalihalobacillus sp. LMS39]
MKIRQELLAAIKIGNLMKFYKSKEWLSLRKKALKRDNYECQMCKSKGSYHKAENVHHIKEVKTHPELALSLNNLQCLCISCHNEIHDRLEETRKPKFMNEERW